MMMMMMMMLITMNDENESEKNMCLLVCWIGQCANDNRDKCNHYVNCSDRYTFRSHSNEFISNEKIVY